MPSPIRKPRYWLSSHGPRFTGFRKGQYVFYWWRGQPHRYVVIGFDDCYDWAYQGGFVPGMRQRYSIYLEIAPVRAKSGDRVRIKVSPPTGRTGRAALLVRNLSGPGRRLGRRRRLRTDVGIMRYNEQVWAAGFPGHAVDPTELFHSRGEAMFQALCRS